MKTSGRSSMFRIAVLAPMRSELRPLVTRLALSRSAERGAQFRVGSMDRIEIVAARTGIGMQRATECARRVLEAASPDHVVVVGIAGGIGRSVAIGDLIVPEIVMNLDTGETFRAAPLGDQRLGGTLASSDRLIGSPGQARELEASGTMAIDMETAAIAEVCSKHGCAWSAFRAISDRADDGTTDAAVLALAGPDGTPDLAAVARFVVRHPGRIPQLVRLARGANVATHRAADAAVAAISSLREDDRRWRPRQDSNL